MILTCLRKTLTSKCLIRSLKSSYCTKMKPNFITIDVGGHVLRFETGLLAKMADGSVVGSIDETTVLATAVCKPKTSGIGFTPLTVDYRHKAAAAGRIPSNFLRRELGASDLEILTSRMIDRSIRPLFSKGFSHDVQVTCNVLAVDGVNDPDVAAINASSAALALSDVPWNGPLAAVRLGYVDETCVINPTRRQLQNSRLNGILAAASGGRIIMLDVSANELPLEEFLNCVKTGLRETEKIIEQMMNMKNLYGKPIRSTLEKLSVPEDQYIDAALLLAETRLKEIYTTTTHTKLSRDNAVSELRKEVVTKLKENFATQETSASSSDVQQVSPQVLDESFTVACKRVFRRITFASGQRADGRSLTDIRPISCQVDLLAPLHGSALFQRGHTQVLATVALDSLESSFRSDAISVLMGADKEKTFMLNYQFPPYANNEIGSGRPGRRELGHGALAEKALKCLMPNNFPFSTRLTCEVLESNGSSSMASVCAGSLALMDAGVQIKAPAAGVAIGLLTEVNSEDPTKIDEYRLLTDITGLEDYMGDMDFKIAATSDGLTALQLDVKLQCGLTFDMLIESLKRAKEAHAKILDVMASQGMDQPRASLKTNGPVSEDFIVPLVKRSRLLGPGGYNIKMLELDTGVQFTQLDQYKYRIFATNKNALAEAKESIEKLLAADDRETDYEFGAIYTAKIIELTNGGVLVTLKPNSLPVFVPNSQLDQRKVDHPSALGLKVGDDLHVKYFGYDEVGKMRLSRKVLQRIGSTKKIDMHQEKEVGSPWIGKTGG